MFYSLILTILKPFCSLRVYLAGKRITSRNKDSRLMWLYGGEDGTQYYCYENPANMSVGRALQAEKATKYAEMAITKAELLRLFGMAKNMAEDGQLVNTFAILKEIENRMEFAAEEETLFQLAGVYFLAENETAEYDAKFVAEKIERWKKSPKDSDFFLQNAWQLTLNIQHTYITDIIPYLTAAKELKERNLTQFPKL